ncbi:hypothetical protein VNO77_13119 [Canavalia gladiata]|uniref:Uncharacterized protein n=1 Tax=Canavalia gladiata TaxID=3824 RepID=A0AAN9LX19_CANGL
MDCISHFSILVANFLGCNIGDMPFKYLGLLIDDNPCKEKRCWTRIIQAFCNRLIFQWVVALLCLTTCVLLLLYKAPPKVLNQLILLQRTFLWGGPEALKRIAWVENGGLGVKCLPVFNQALLLKWRWRILHNPQGKIWTT